MAKETEVESFTVEGGHIGWEERCLLALSEAPFKFVAADEGAHDGREFLASCSPFLGPIGYVHVGVVPEGPNTTRLQLTAEVMADNPLREVLRPGAKVIMKRLKRTLGVP